MLAQIESAFLGLDIDEKQKQINILTEELADSSVWNNPTSAQSKSKQLANLSSTIEPWVTLRVQSADMLELIKIGDDSLMTEFEQQVDALEINYKKLKMVIYMEKGYIEYK